REESLRRHLEEVAGDGVETLAIAGFYAVDMLYQGMGHPKAEAHCPVIVTPRHRVTETPVEEHTEAASRWHKIRGSLQKAARQVHDHSRGTLTGMIVCGAGGLVASAPLITRVLFPRQTSSLRRKAGDW